MIKKFLSIRRRPKIIGLTAAAALSVSLAFASSVSFYMIGELIFHAAYIQGSSPSLDNRDLEVFSDLGNLKIIGLGEATHGTKEFFEMKHRIFKYFVTVHDSRAFGFECDFAESIHLDRYVTRGEGDLKNLMSSKMHFWTWHTAEVAALLQWMHDANLVRAEEEKIHFLGFDCQFTDQQSALLREYFLKFAAGIPVDIEAVLAEVQALKTSEFQSMTSERKDELLAKIAALDRFLSDREGEARLALSRLDYEFAKQLIRTAAQAVEVEYGYYHGLASQRDYYMAQNALWMRRLFSENCPLVLWAHNGHIAKDPIFGGTGSQGYFLKTELGDGYQAIGFTFCRGSFMAVAYDYQTRQYMGLQSFTISQDPKPDSVNDLFDRAILDQFILRFDRLNPKGPLASWLGAPQEFLDIGAVFGGNPDNFYSRMDILDYFDALIHFQSTNAAEQLNRY